MVEFLLLPPSFLYEARCLELRVPRFLPVRRSSKLMPFLITFLLDADLLFFPEALD